MSKRDVGMFCAGLVTGAIGGLIGGVFAVRRYYDKLFLERESDLYDKIDTYKLELEESMEARIASTIADRYKYCGVDEVEEEPPVKTFDPGYPKAKKQPYNKMYKEGNVQPPTDEDDEDTEEEEESEYGDDVSEQDVEAFELHQKHLRTNRKPRLITQEAYDALGPEVSKWVLMYYSGNQVLCDENDEPIEDAFQLVGDALDKYDFANSDELVVFVQNYQLETAYEVQRIPGEYLFEVN